MIAAHGSGLDYERERMRTAGLVYVRVRAVNLLRNERDVEQRGLIEK